MSKRSERALDYNYQRAMKYIEVMKWEKLICVTAALTMERFQPTHDLN